METRVAATPRDAGVRSLDPAHAQERAPLATATADQGPARFERVRRYTWADTDDEVKIYARRLSGTRGPGYDLQDDVASMPTLQKSSKAGFVSGRASRARVPVGPAPTPRLLPTEYPARGRGGAATRPDRISTCRRRGDVVRSRAQVQPEGWDFATIAADDVSVTLDSPRSLTARIDYGGASHKLVLTNFQGPVTDLAWKKTKKRLVVTLKKRDTLLAWDKSWKELVSTKDRPSGQEDAEEAD